MVFNQIDPENTCEHDDAAAPAKKVVKVFLMLGQSNMLGFGRVQSIEKAGTLMNLVLKQGKYQNLLDQTCTTGHDGTHKWNTLENVRYVKVGEQKGSMAVLNNEQLTVSEKQNFFGPELGFGHVVGPWMKRQQGREKEPIDDENILLLKSCVGNRSLGWDLLPPKSERFEHGDKVYAGYKDDPECWSKDPNVPPKPVKVWYAGKQYDTDIGLCKKVLSNISDYYPGATNYEIAGFVWWQGHKDQYSAVHSWRYEHNLAHLIRTLREEFDAPQAKFVCATVAFNGYNMKNPSPIATILDAQIAVSEETGKYPEFKDNVKTIDARPYWREAKVSPANQGHHYHQNAETFYEVGRELGEAMIQLLEKQSHESVDRKTNTEAAIATTK